MKKVDVYADVTRFAATSFVAQYVVVGLLRAGVDVVTVPLINESAETLSKCDQVFVSTMGAPRAGALKVAVRPAGKFSSFFTKDAVVVTMWETDQLMQGDIDLFNTAKAVIVASKWQQDRFKKNGVERPVYVGNYGADEVYCPSTREFPKRCVFLTAGRSAHGLTRKGLDRVICAFLLAFPYDDDVVLQVKIQDDCPLLPVHSPKIQVIRDWLPKEQMADWYRQGLVYVNGSMGECWGFHVHEAMACGRAVIGADFGGVTEYFNKRNGYVVPHTMVKADSMVHTHDNSFMPMTGKWAQMSVDDLAQAMRRVYENPVDAFLRGLLAAEDVKHLTMEAMYSTYVKLILRYA
jgi:glycosyltransferase involved in cell wall biosynthesis